MLYYIKILIIYTVYIIQWGQSPTTDFLIQFNTFNTINYKSYYKQNN